MQVEVIIQHGKAMLAKPIYLKESAPSRLFVEINDEDVELDRDWFPESACVSHNVAQRGGQAPDVSHSPVQARFNAILGPLARIRPEPSIADDHKVFLGALDARQGGAEG